MENKKGEEMCISKEEYDKLINKMNELLGFMAEYSIKINNVEESTHKVEKVVLGNGDPSRGLATQVSILKQILDNHLAKHDYVETKAWDVAKPILSKFAEWIVLGGIFYFIATQV